MSDNKRSQKPAQNPEAREKQLCQRAYDLAERQLEDGTASSAVITHFLKLATRREVLEQDILQKQMILIDAKAKRLGNDTENEDLARAAIEAMKNYRSSE